MRILLTGAEGQVGYELQRSLACLGTVVATDRMSMDLAATDVLAEKVRQAEPDLIVNAAAYTAVDKAEQEVELATAVNAIAPGVLAHVAVELGIPLIHYSTDYVFNGEQSRPWLEDDPVDPVNRYGYTKLAGEQAIEQSGADYLIFRTSWVYGARGHNFLLTMNRLRDRETLSVVDDQVGAPTWSRHIADCTAQIIVQSLYQADFWQQHRGIYHLSGGGKTSWYGFAKAIFELLAQKGLAVPQLKAIPSSDYTVPARRPLFSCLDNQKLLTHFGLQLPDWHDSLEMVMRDAVFDNT